MVDDIFFIIIQYMYGIMGYRAIQEKFMQNIYMVFNN